MLQFYETPRLLLRELDEHAAQDVLAYFIRNRDFLAPWEPDKQEDFYTAKYQKKVLRAERERISDGDALKLWIFLKRTGRIIGAVNLSNIIRGPFLSCFLGYRLDAQETGKGYMTEAAGKMVEIAFDILGLHRVEANIMPRNGRSLRVVEKLGFKREGLAERYLKIHGKWEDHIHMVKLNDRLEEYPDEEK